MFKSTFGANTSGFGSFGASTSTAASPFGGFKPAAGTSAFGAPPAFGTPVAGQTTTGGGLFGTANTSTGGLFGTTQAAAAPAFGTPSSGFGFGASTSTGGGLFGAPASTGGGLFGQQQTTAAFGAKPAGFGFGSTATTGTTGLFGSTQPATTSLFGQQNNSMTGGGLFTNTAGAFGQQQAAAGTAHVKYNPVVGTDVVVKSGTSQNINIKHHCITCMKEYENKSLEELRLEDYTAGRKGSTAGVFGGFQSTTEAKPLFGATSTFGQPTATTASSVFGGGLGTTSGFGQTNTFSFGQPAQNATNTTGLFGAAKPAFGAAPTTGTGLFGAATTQASTFGTTTPSFGFGGTTQNQTTGGLFGAKPATTGFGTTQPATGFGGFGSGGGMFGAKPAQSSAPAFGTAAPAFGSLNTSGFGTNTSTSGGLFGSAFKPTTSTQPAFGGFGTNTSGLGTGLGSNLGSNTFQAKPQGSAFGTLGGGLFQNNTTNFGSGLGESSLGGGGIFGNTTNLGGSALGMGIGTNASLMGNSNIGGGSAAGNVHEQMLTLVARPYGDSALFKDLVPDAPSTTDAVSATNPHAVGAILQNSAYRVTSPNMRLRVQPRPQLTRDKKSLFDGLEESDPSLEDKLTLKPSRKRLVLRPKSQGDEPHSTSHTEQNSNRSLDDLRHSNGPSRDMADKASQSQDESRPKGDRNSYNDNNNSGSSTDRHVSWLNGSNFQFSAEKEKPINEDTPRLYPNLDKEAPIHISERRASWLTTKPLRKPLTINDQAESSVRDLGVTINKSHDKENVDTLYGPSTSKQATDPNWESIARQNRMIHGPSLRKAEDPSLTSIARLTQSQEEENVPPRDMPPHPTGVKLTRPGYYTIPSLDDMIKYMRPDGSCVVPHLTIGRKNYGNVYYDCEIDVAGLDLDALVHFLNKEVTVYPDDSAKPPVGQGLNRRAIVTLDRIWPRDKTEKKPITDPERLLAMDYEGKLRRVCDKHDTKFIEYRPMTGSWVFRVEHFSKYSLTDSDEEDEITPEILRKQLVNQQLQKSAPLAPPKPPATAPPGLTSPSGFGAFASGHGPMGLTSAPGLTGPTPIGLGGSAGLGGLSSGLGGSSPGLGGSSTGLGSSAGLGGLSSGLVGVGGSITGLGGSITGLGGPGLVPSGPGLSMSGGVSFAHSDLMAMHQTSLNLLNGAGKAFEMDTTEDNTESQSMYQDSHRAYGVKSPTSELARLEHRQSHNVQLMKACLYADAEMEDDISISTGDQMVPRCSSVVMLPSSIGSREKETAHDDDMHEEVTMATITEEVVMRPLIVRPHTVVLKYHRKVPPFKQTIAGSVDAALLADMHVCRARHSRVGFGPGGDVAYATSYDAIADLPKDAELCDLSKYVRGRTEDDWSEITVARVAIGKHNHMLETLARHLQTLLQHSTFVESEGECPLLVLKASSSDRRDALTHLLRNYQGTAKTKQSFGVSNAYCHEVFRLCEALWGADLENDGVPGTDELSIVNRHRLLLQWLTEAVRDITERELSTPTAGEDMDESDCHSGRVWTLLLGGRTLEACKVARDAGDLNMAAIIAQAAGDQAFRSLVARQLSQWSECGAASLICPVRLSALYLIAGVETNRDRLMTADWLRAFHATARFLCRQVPSLETVVRTFESLLPSGWESQAEDVAIDLQPCPLPPYRAEYDLTASRNGVEHRVLDLRYELIRARAMNSRPKLQPAGYTPDPMDYSLCFILGVWFGNPTIESITGIADQLEACGAWHLAIQALMYLPESRTRAHLIRGLLSRHAPSKASTPETASQLNLLTTLRIPEKWVLLARAHRAKYEHLSLLECEYLIGAEQYNAAHKVLVQELLPEAVLADDLQSLSPLLDKLNEAAQRNEVSEWQSGGQALHYYISVCDEIRGLVTNAESTDRTTVQHKIESLRPRVVGACRALGRLSASTPRHAAARTECGARLVQLALAAGEPAKHLAQLLKVLGLPPDCTTNAQQKITQDLAEQASDLCIESVNSSPISSHHRATVIS